MLDMLQDLWIFFKKLPQRQQIMIGTGIATGTISLYYLNNKLSKKKESKSKDPNKKKDSGKFLKELREIIKIVIPSLNSKEFLILLAHTGALVMRTVFSLYIAFLDGKIVQSLVKGHGKTFFKRIGFLF
jgi:ATP-binding cassette, subfamily D (ALD), peroxisomal long-chain fatty acid import protein